MIAGVIALVAVAVAGAAASSRSEREAAHAAGIAAYVHGFPPLISQASQARFPQNTLVGVAATSTAANRIVVLPNVDTAYSVSRLDLRAGPLIVGVPASPHRYYVLQLMDAYTNVFGYIGFRTTGTRAAAYALVGPSYRGSVPGHRTIRSPTPDALLLGRTLVRPGDTTASLSAVLGAYTLTPLASLAAGGAPRHSVVIASGARGSTPPPPSGTAFLAALDQFLVADPPSAAERRALAGLARFGVGAGAFGAVARLSADVRAALVRGIDAGPAHVSAVSRALETGRGRSHAGWRIPPPAIGRYGSDWDLRAVTATDALWANTPDEAVYYMTERDGASRSLSGAHRYTLRFATAPPARAFWSVTMYDSGRHLYANPLNRYALGDRNLSSGGDGSYTLRLQHRRPSGPAADWLPSPSGHFLVVLRLYVPTGAVLRGRWRPPGIVCTDCHARR